MPLVLYGVQRTRQAPQRSVTKSRRLFAAPGCDAAMTVCLINSEMQNSPNENKISDGYRERALIEAEVF